jgi:hypothetical protein
MLWWINGGYMLEGCTHQRCRGLDSDGPTLTDAAYVDVVSDVHGWYVHWIAVGLRGWRHPRTM